MKRLLSLLLAALMLTGLAACKKDDTDATEAKDTTQAGTGSETADLDADAVFFESEHYTVTTAEFQYFLAKVYDDFASQYGDAISYLLDTSKSLRSQSCPVDETGEMTWFDYFADGAMETVEDYIILAEEAHAAGFELSEEDLELINGELDDLDGRADEAGYDSVDEYIRDYYGSLCTKESLYNCFTLFYLANSYREQVYNGYSLTDEDYLAYANKNPADCYYADFMYMRVTADIAEGATDAEKAAEWEETKKIAVDFNNAVSDKDSFFEQAEKYLRSVCTMVDSEEEVDYDTYHLTENALLEATKGAETVGVKYSTGTANVDWIFAEGRKAGEQTVIMDEENYSCEIIYMLQPMYLSEQPTVDVRHILISSDEAGDEYKAGEQAKALYDQWLAGDADESSFAALAVENSDDTGSVSAGGLYSGVTPGQMVTEFNDWCFDASRQSGDHGIVKTEFGSHIMYFVSHGLPRWKSTADTALRDAAIIADMEEMEKEHSLKRYDESLDKCPDLFGE